MLERIWKDSVWSKVISTAIIGLVTFSFLKFKSITEKITFEEALSKITSIKISVFYLVIFILIITITKSIFQKLFKTKGSIYNKNQKKLREYNKSIDIEMGIMSKWIVHFKHNGTPFISDSTFFCTKHNEIPLKLINGNCPIFDCDNHRINLDEFKTENYIESSVIHEWEKINNSK